MLPFIWYISTGANTLSDFSTIITRLDFLSTVTLKLTWRTLNVTYCTKKINSFRKDNAIFVQPSFTMLCCLVPSLLPQKIPAKSRFTNYKYLLNQIIFSLFSFTHTNALYMYLCHGMCYHIPGGDFVNKICCHIRVENLYRLESMGVGT